jgi:predicted nuclease with TOPRIM domain
MVSIYFTKDMEIKKKHQQMNEKISFKTKENLEFQKEVEREEEEVEEGDQIFRHLL